MQIHGTTGSTATQATSALRGAGGPPRRPDGDGDGGGRVHHGGPRGGGPMAQAVMQTLSQLGLQTSAIDGEDADSDTSSTSGSSSTSSTTSSSTSTDSPTDGTSALREDLHALMHALFQALRGNSNGSSGSDGSKEVGPPPDLQSALGALATRAANGQAPAALQQAFETLSQDLQGGSEGGSAPSLQSFLQTLQQQLGSGGPPQMASTGQSLQVQA